MSQSAAAISASFWAFAARLSLRRDLVPVFAEVDMLVAGTVCEGRAANEQVETAG